MKRNAARRRCSIALDSRTNRNSTEPQWREAPTQSFHARWRLTCADYSVAPLRGQTNRAWGRRLFRWSKPKLRTPNLPRWSCKQQRRRGDLKPILREACSQAYPESAICVQRFDYSRKAIRITYRISLRSSSLQEPRYPLLRVVLSFVSFSFTRLGKEGA